MRTRILIVFVLTSVSIASSQTVNKAKLDSLFDVLAQKNMAMGSVAISKNGKLLYARAIGYSSISNTDKIQATTATKYRIGSVTKMFTATMILQLIQEGKLALNTRLGRFFPSLPNAGTITVADLLNMRSGLHSFTAEPDYVSWMTKPKTEEEMLAIIASEKPDFQPGEKFSYSNTNYVLLGYIIERITRKSYAENLKQRITSKIGLSNTYVGRKTDIADGEGYSYSYNGTWEQDPVTNMSIPGGAGAIVSTPTDLTKFIGALFAGKLISPASLKEMCTMVDGYGMGMMELPFYKRRAYGHGGAIDGFASLLGYFPEDSLAFAYCSNGQAYPPNDVMIGVLSICYGMPYSIPTFLFKAENIERYVGIYSSTQLPLKITITIKDSALVAQGTGQSPFPLEAIAKNTFEFARAGIVIQFDSTKSEFTLHQGGRSFFFTKEK